MRCWCTKLATRSIFLTTNRLFDWLQIPSVSDKTNKHATIYNSYSLEQAITFIESISIKNVSNTCSVTNELKYNISDATDKTYALHKTCYVELQRLVDRTTIGYTKNCQWKLIISQTKLFIFI